MKKIISYAFIGLFSIAASAQTGSVKLKGTRLTHPVIKKWITEFNKQYPNIKVEIAPKAPADSTDIEVFAYDISKEPFIANKEYVVVNRYVQLPIANNKRPGLAELQAKGFTEADFNKVYFSSEPGQVAAGSAPIVIYKRDRPVCATKSFASHYGNNPSTAPGVGISGDDKDLAFAVKKDPNGLSYNNLGFIYDLKTRKVADSLSIIPLDLNENGKVDSDEKIYGTLDEVIAFTEKTNHPKIPLANVNALFRKDTKNPSVGIFLNWVLTQGQKYNHEFGFVNHEGKQLSKQQEIITANFKK